MYHNYRVTIIVKLAIPQVVTAAFTSDVNKTKDQDQIFKTKTKTTGSKQRHLADLTFKQACAAEMAVRYAALCACRKLHYVTLAYNRKPKFFSILDVRS